MPAINYKFNTKEIIYFLRTLPKGTRMLQHVTDNILKSKVVSVYMSIDPQGKELIMYNIITADQRQRMNNIKEECIFKTKNGALCAAIKEVEKRKVAVQEDLDKQIGTLDQLVVDIKMHSVINVPV